VLVAGVVRHQVHQDADPSSAGLGNEAIDVFHGAELWLYGDEVGDVVAPVRVGRSRDRREPDTVDTQPLQVVQVRDEPRKVPDAVTIGVGERSRIDLIKNT